MKITKLDFDCLPKYKDRSFVSDDVDLKTTENIISLYNKLIECDINTAEELEAWIADWSELDSVIDQYSTVLYIKMTCHTDNKEYAEEYTEFVKTVPPAIKPLEDKLNRKYLSLKEKISFNDEYYVIFDRDIKSDIDLYREENVPLITQDQLLSQEYQSICGSMMVMFEGKELTLPQMSKLLFDTDRTLRESAWRLIAERRYREKGKFDNMFDKMVKLRHEIALNAGCKNYCDYQFKNYHRFDYTPGDCKKYHSIIKENVVPVLEKILERRKLKMNLSNIKPWDLQVDPQGRPALKPFKTSEELIAKVAEVFGHIDKGLGTQLCSIAERGLLDLNSRKGKAPGGYQSVLAEARLPFIFMNSVGVDDDIRTLLHEGGHAFHSLACAQNILYNYRHAPMEFCEVASMSMELLGGEYLSVFYNEEDVNRSRNDHLEGVVQILIWVAIVDSFQHWVYENPMVSSEERNSKWMEISNNFGANLVDWRGLDKFLQTAWHRQLHIFEVPFYYIEYGIAQLGALQIWKNFSEDKHRTIEMYKGALALGGSVPLSRLFETAGLKFDFSKAVIEPVMDMLNNELFD